MTADKEVLASQLLIESLDIVNYASIEDIQTEMSDIPKLAMEMLHWSGLPFMRGGSTVNVSGIKDGAEYINIEISGNQSLGAVEQISGLVVPKDIPFFLGQTVDSGDETICTGVSKLSGATLYPKKDKVLGQGDKLLAYFDFTNDPGKYAAIPDLSGNYRTMYPYQNDEYYSFLPDGGLKIGESESGSTPQESTKYAAQFKGVYTEVDTVTLVTTFSIDSISGNNLEITDDAISLINGYGLNVELLPPNSQLLADDHYGLMVETQYPTRVKRIYSFAASRIYDRNRWELVENSSLCTTRMKAITKDEFNRYLLRPMTWVVQAGAHVVDGEPGVRLYINDELFLEEKYHTVTPTFYAGGNLALGRGLMDYTIWNYILFGAKVEHRYLVTGVPNIGWMSPVFSVPEGPKGSADVYLTSILPEDSPGYTLKYRVTTEPPEGVPIKIIEDTDEEITYEIYPPDTWSGEDTWTEINKVNSEEIPTPVYLQYTIRFESWRD